MGGAARPGTGLNSEMALFPVPWLRALHQRIPWAGLCLPRFAPERRRNKSGSRQLFCLIERRYAAHVYYQWY